MLQECATDSEELIYPMRAPSACSAPPDLLLTGDREPLDRMSSHSVPKDVKMHASSTGAAAAPTDCGEVGGDSADAKRMLLEVRQIKGNFLHLKCMNC